MSHRLENITASLLQQRAQVLTKPESLALVAAELHATKEINRHLRQKISNQRQQLRRLQALYNAYLIGCKGGAHQAQPGNVQFLPCAVSGEIPAPTEGFLTQGRKVEASA